MRNAFEIRIRYHSSQQNTSSQETQSATRTTFRLSAYTVSNKICRCIAKVFHSLSRNTCYVACQLLPRDFNLYSRNERVATPIAATRRG